jgi:hypothetical protein
VPPILLFMPMTQIVACLGFVVGVSLCSSTTASESERPKLRIINGSTSVVDVYRLKSPVERVPNGSIQPNEDTTIATTLGQEFVVVNRDDSSEMRVISEVPIQACRVGGIPALYTQRANAHGFPITASANVNPYAVAEAVYIVDLMLANRPDIREAMIKSGSRLCVMAYNEFTTDLPEWKWLANKPVAGFEAVSARDYRDARARGLGGSATDPYCSCAEENLLGYQGDPYNSEAILIHEFAHNIHLRGMNNIDPTFDDRLKATYETAMARGLWKRTYASVEYHEYFAEGVQSWFDTNRENEHDHVNTRIELIEYDPGLADLCREVFGDTELRYTKPSTRLVDHLVGYDPTQSPKFAFPPRLDHARKLIRESAEKRRAK